MSMRHTVLAASAAILLVGGIAGTAFAFAEKNDEAQEAQALAQAKVTLVEAIQIAEKRAGGRGIDASLDDESGFKLYEVEVLTGGNVENVRIDAQTGKVAKVTHDDMGDNDENGDRD